MRKRIWNVKSVYYSNLIRPPDCAPKFKKKTLLKRNAAKSAMTPLQNILRSLISENSNALFIDFLFLPHPLCNGNPRVVPRWCVLSRNESHPSWPAWELLMAWIQYVREYFKQAVAEVCSAFRYKNVALQVFPFSKRNIWYRMKGRTRWKENV